MPAAGVVTIILTLVTVAALAAYLIRVALVLKHVNSALGRVIAGVRDIEVATRPVTPILGSIADDLAATQKALEDLLARKAAARSNGPVLVSRLAQRGAVPRR
jgi:hypothetical protein